MSSAVTKGIVVAGGTGSRLRPVTRAVNKHLLPVYDKPMIYYPISNLMLAGIRDLLLVSSVEDLPQFQRLLQDGSQLGISIQYKVQQEPKGIAQAFQIADEFIGRESVALHLGDNLFYGQGLHHLLINAAKDIKGAKIFAYRVQNPTQFGIVSFDADGNVEEIEEKPAEPKSNFAVVGIYFYDNRVVDIARQVQLSSRGEYEISDVNRAYLDLNALQCERLGRGFAWLDTGSHQSLIHAANFVETLEARQGLKLACLEEIACIKGYISIEQLEKQGREIQGDYGKYLVTRAAEIAEGIR
ncbi:MAG: glucose-1-phosphate thymidylyltransferase RfbA [Planctomycetota bacterium]